MIWASVGERSMTQIGATIRKSIANKTLRPADGSGVRVRKSDDENFVSKERLSFSAN
jgi:hypothetical protein